MMERGGQFEQDCVREHRAVRVHWGCLVDCVGAAVIMVNLYIQFDLFGD